MYDYLQFREQTSKIQRVFSKKTISYVINALDNGICQRMDQTLNMGAEDKAKCLVIQGDTEVGLY